MKDGAYDRFALNKAILMRNPDAKDRHPSSSVAVISQEVNTHAMIIFVFG